MPMLDVMEQQKKLKNSALYTPVKVGNEWKGKTPLGVVTRKTKTALIETLESWRKIAIMNL
jgi:hypothetical protein